ncbi:unnamed protein product, partial [Brassica rapa]
VDLRFPQNAIPKSCLLTQHRIIFRNQHISYNLLWAMYSFSHTIPSSSPKSISYQFGLCFYLNSTVRDTPKILSLSRMLTIYIS